MSLKVLSESEEMYLVTIRTLCEGCTDTPVSISKIAKELGVQPVSANQMINKLAEDEYVKYTPYKGVELTESGMEISTRILRHRLLWEVFFIDKLKMELEEADQLACHFEHHTSPDLADRLSLFLDNPTVSYRGEPIPQPDSEKKGLVEAISLKYLKVGHSSPVMRIEAGEAVSDFLRDEGIQPGKRIAVVAIGNHGDRLVESEGRHLHLSVEMVNFILISPEMQALFSEDEEEDGIPLSELKTGEKGIIIKMNFKGAIRKRLLAMGFATGESIQVKKVAPFGDPLDFVIKGYELSLRKSEAKQVLVRRVVDNL